jgi:uncharacterized protein
MDITVTGATGLIGRRLVAALTDRGDRVTVLSRDAGRARAALGVEAVAWDPVAGQAPCAALDGRDAVLHLAGAPVAQRWTARAKDDIVRSRVLGTRNLVAGLLEAGPRPAALIAASAVGYYGDRGDAVLGEDAPPGDDFLARACVGWEAEADAAAALGVRVARLRTGVVLDRSGGALETMLPPFRAGLGGPVGGGEQYLPWIHADDVVGMYLAALDGDWRGPYNASAPDPVTNRAFAKALGRALRRPAVLPVPALALRLRYGEMSTIVTAGQRAVPRRALQAGHAFRHPGLDAALADALA